MQSKATHTTFWILLFAILFSISDATLANRFVPESSCTSVYILLDSQNVLYQGQSIAKINSAYYLHSDFTGTMPVTITTGSETITEYVTFSETGIIYKDTAISKELLGLEEAEISLPSSFGSFYADSAQPYSVEKLSENIFKYSPSRSDAMAGSITLIFYAKNDDSTKCSDIYSYRIKVPFVIQDGTCVNYSLLSQQGDYSQLEEPVCGCNGITFQNAIIAREKHGISNYSQGVCPRSTFFPTLIPQDTLCFVDSAEYAIPHSYSSYYWSNGSVKQTTLFDSTGVFFVTVTDENGAMYWDSIHLFERDTFRTSIPSIVDISYSDRILVNEYFVNMPFDIFSEYRSRIYDGEGTNIIVSHSAYHIERGAITVALLPSAEIASNSCYSSAPINITYVFNDSPPNCTIDPDPLIEVSNDVFPVCGCDGNTYQNWEQAQIKNGVVSYIFGACNTQKELIVNDTMCAGSINFPQWNNNNCVKRLILNDRLITNLDSIKAGVYDALYSYYDTVKNEAYSLTDTITILESLEPPIISVDYQQYTLSAEQTDFNVIWIDAKTNIALDTAVSYNFLSTPTVCQYAAYNERQNIPGCFSKATPVSICSEPEEFNPFAKDSACISNIDSLFAGTGFTSYAWNNEDQSPSISVTDGGWHTLTVTTNAGKSFSDSIFISTPQQTVINETIDAELGSLIQLNIQGDLAIETTGTGKTIALENGYAYLPSKEDFSNQSVLITQTDTTKNVCVDTLKHIQSVYLSIPMDESCYDLGLIDLEEGVKYLATPVDSVCGYCNNTSYTNSIIAKKLFGQKRYTVGGCSETAIFAEDLIAEDTVCFSGTGYTLNTLNNSYSHLFIDAETMFPENEATLPVLLSEGTHSIKIKTETGKLMQDSITAKKTIHIECPNLTDTATKGKMHELAKLDYNQFSIRSFSQGETNTNTIPFTYMASKNSKDGDIATAQILPKEFLQQCVEYSEASYSLYIEVAEALTYNTLLSHPKNKLSSDGSISISIHSGNIPYHYRWSNGDSISTITNLPAGTYSVTISDSKGNNKTESFTLTAKDQRLFSISGMMSDSTKTPISATVYAFLLENGHITAGYKSSTNNGIFSISNILPGKYYLLAIPNSTNTYTPSYYCKAKLYNQAYLLDVSSEIIDIDIVLDKYNEPTETGPASIEGNLSIANSSSADSVFAQGDTIAVGVPIALLKNDSLYAYSISTDKGYLFDGLQYGTYTVMPNIPGGNFYKTEITLSETQTKKVVQFDIATRLQKKAITNGYRIFPNPTTDGIFFIEGPMFKSVAFYTTKGEFICSMPYKEIYSAENLPKGLLIMLIFPETGSNPISNILAH